MGHVGPLPCCPQENWGLTLSGAGGPGFTTSQMVGTWLRLSAAGKSGMSAMSDSESAGDERMDAVDRSSRYESCKMHMLNTPGLSGELPSGSPQTSTVKGYPQVRLEGNLQS